MFLPQNIKFLLNLDIILAGELILKPAFAPALSLATSQQSACIMYNVLTVNPSI